MNDSDDEDDGRLEAVMLLRTDPLRGLFGLIKSIEVDRERGHSDVEHSGLDLMVDALLSVGAFPDVVEAVIARLVAEDPDATHLNMWARLLEIKGRTEEAAAVRARASAAPDSHSDPELTQLVKDRLAARKKRD